MTDTIFALRWNQSHWMKSSPNFPKAQLVKRNDLWWSEIHCYSEKSEIFRKCLKNIQIFLFLLIIIVVSEPDVWKQAIMNNKGQRIMVCSHEIYLYIFSRKKRKNIWPGYEFKLSSFSSTHIHWLPPMGPPNPIYELVIIQTCLLHITQITIAMQGLSSLTNTFYVFFLSCFSSIIHEYHCSESRRWILDLVQVMMGAEPYSFMIFFTKTNDDGS